MQWGKVITGLLAAGVVVALITAVGAFTIVAGNQSNNTSKQDEEIKELLIDMKSMMARTNERMDMLVERMDAVIEGMDMMMGMVMGDIMGPMDGMQGDMMNQEPQDVIIQLKAGHGRVSAGEETEIVLSVLDKVTEEPLEGLEVLIHIEKGPSMSSMDMMGDMFPAEDKGSGEYVVRFTPDSEGVYTVHVMVMIPRKSMMDNHMDFSIIAE